MRIFLYSVPLIFCLIALYLIHPMLLGIFTIAALLVITTILTAYGLIELEKIIKDRK